MYYSKDLIKILSKATIYGLWQIQIKQECDKICFCFIIPNIDTIHE